MSLQEVYSEELGRSLLIRPGTSDVEGWKAIAENRFHVPPAEMPAPKTILDLGSNIGVTAAHYQSLWPDAIVWMVEPNPDNLVLARMNSPQGVPFEMAVGTKTGLAFLKEEGHSADAYSLGDDGRRVFAISLENLLGLVGAVDFCKMDIEGTEWDVLDQLDGIKHLLVEFHDEPRDYPSILGRGLAALRERGWHVQHHPPHPAAVFATCPSGGEKCQ